MNERKNSNLSQSPLATKLPFNHVYLLQYHNSCSFSPFFLSHLKPCSQLIPNQTRSHVGEGESYFVTPRLTSSCSACFRSLFLVHSAARSSACPSSGKYAGSRLFFLKSAYQSRTITPEIRDTRCQTLIHCNCSPAPSKEPTSCRSIRQMSRRATSQVFQRLAAAARFPVPSPRNERSLVYQKATLCNSGLGYFNR